MNGKDIAKEWVIGVECKYHWDDGCNFEFERTDWNN